MRGAPLHALSDEKGIFGLVFEANFCAEQECGIKTIKDLLNIDSDKIGVDGRTGYADSDSYGCGDDWFIIASNYRNDPWTKERAFHPEAMEGCMGGWSDRDVGVCLTKKATPDIKEATSLIIQALKDRKPLVVCLGGSNNPFRRPGLTVCLREEVDKRPEINQLMTDADNEHHRLATAWEPVRAHLRKLLDKPVMSEIQKWYFAQSTYEHVRDSVNKPIRPYYMAPRELRPEPVKNSQYRFRIWLNPSDQDIYESGWYTVEELEAWARGEGPVIERSKYGRLYAAIQKLRNGEKAYPPDYYAICTKCQHIHYDGNCSGRSEMLNKPCRDSHGYERLVSCPKCEAPGETFVFGDDNPIKE